MRKTRHPKRGRKRRIMACHLSPQGTPAPAFSGPWAVACHDADAGHRPHTPALSRTRRSNDDERGGTGRRGQRGAGRSFGRTAPAPSRHQRQNLPAMFFPQRGAPWACVPPCSTPTDSHHATDSRRHTPPAPIPPSLATAPERRRQAGFRTEELTFPLSSDGAHRSISFPQVNGLRRGDLRAACGLGRPRGHTPLEIRSESGPPRATPLGFVAAKLGFRGPLWGRVWAANDKTPMGGRRVTTAWGMSSHGTARCHARAKRPSRYRPAAATATRSADMCRMMLRRVASHSPTTRQYQSI